MVKWLLLLGSVLSAQAAQAKIQPTYHPQQRHDKVNMTSTEIPAVRKAKPAERRQTLCLALGLYHEARSESPEGQRAVGHVILNRVKESGHTICDTVRAHGQFAPTINQTPEEIASWKAMQEQAVALQSDPGWDNSHGATMFYNFKLAHPKWAKGALVTAQYGDHIFIRP